MSQFQKTILKDLKLEGVGLHTGEISKIVIKPAKENSGIIFHRVDFSNPVIIKANIGNVLECNRGTTIGINDVKIFTIEHLLSALYGLGIDNVIIEIDNIEPPILDGSSKIFVDEILKVGIKKLPAIKKYIKILEPINYTNNDISIQINPSDNYSVSFDADFSFGNIEKQSFKLNSIKDYCDDISLARTFCSLNELTYLKDRGLIKGGNLENAVVFLDVENNKNDLKKIENLFNVNVDKNNETMILNDNSLRYPDEPVRHKILDLIGDFALLEYSIIGHIHSTKGGHSSNIETVKLVNDLIKKKFILDKNGIKKIIPHRDPFLLIDEIIARSEKNVCAIKHITSNEYFFKGHFPGNPIMPGVLIVESMAQASCFLSHNTENFESDKIMLLSSIKSSKFINKVIPGDVLFIEVELLKYKLGTAFIKGNVKVNNKVVAKAEFMATISSK